MTKKFEGSDKYGASRRPKRVSALGEVEPTRMGTRDGKEARLPKTLGKEVSGSSTRWEKESVAYSKSILKIYGRCISRLCSSSSRACVMVSKEPVAARARIVSWSRGRGPRGVS
jgi:PAB1-binding protein PBP1